MKILLIGATGFLGRHLSELCEKQGYQLTLVARDQAKAKKFFPRFEVLSELPKQGKFDAVINLAGAPIFDSHWSQKRKREIWQSRVDLTDRLVECINHWTAPPQVLINASAVGVYGSLDDTLADEQTNLAIDKNDFSQVLCQAWEAAATKYDQGRVVILRTGLVLGTDGGLLARMLPMFRLGLGGRLGSGRQWMSWIHVDDWTQAVIEILQNKSIEGAVNMVAPNPVQNRQFTEKLAGQLKRPALFHAPEVVLRLLLAERADLLFVSQRIKPDKLMANGFVFKFPEIDQAFSACVRK